MALLPGHKQNFETLRQAFQAHDAALVDCQVAATGNPVAVICAVNRLPKGDISLVPLARLFDGNPYEEVLPPATSEEGMKHA